MKKIALFLSVFVFVSCSKRFYPEISVSDLENTINYLASDSLKGRKPGEPGDKKAAAFILEKFQKAGLQPLFGNGFQKFGLVAEVELGQANFFQFNGKNYIFSADFNPYSFSANAGLDAEVVFAGYGFSIARDSLKWDDYAGAGVKGKWVLVLKGDPEMDKQESVFVGYSDERSKVLAAVDNGAGGLLLVGGPGFSEKDRLDGLFYDKNSSRYSIPVVQITRALADEILKNSGNTVASLESKLNSNRVPGSFSTGVRINCSAEVIQKQVETQNVAALLPGNDPDLAGEYIVAGAHFDHLGLGGPGSGSRMPDTLAIHNGADDNASGVAAIIELAEKAAFEKKNRRSIIFAAFGAEESGLVGSKEFMLKPPAETSKITAMLNFDMVGRLDTAANSLSIGGTKTALETEEILSRLNPGFNLLFSGEGTGPSDHSSFYLQNIPVFFFSTGAHSDYHTPTDDPSLINFKGEKKVVEYAYEILKELASRDKPLTFREESSQQRSARGGRYKVTLGIMPDFAGIESRGLRVDAVTKGKPADIGGIKKGDIITAIDGKKVGNIYDYMNRLKTFEAGQTISVDVLRGDKPVVLIIRL